MHTCSTLRSLGCAAGLLLALTAAHAQAPDHAGHHAPATVAADKPSGSAAPAQVLTDGVITRIDARNGKLTIRHGAIANLDMPAMTMVFSLQDPSQAASLQPGDQVRFHAEDAGGGQLRITHLEAAPV